VVTSLNLATSLSVVASLNVAARTCARYAEICVYSRLHSPKLIRRLPLCCLRSLISRAASSRLAQRVPGPRARTACRSALAAPPSDGAACKLMLHIARQHNKHTKWGLRPNINVTPLQTGQIGVCDEATLKNVTDHFRDDLQADKLQRQLMLLQDVCEGTDIKTVHDVVSVFRRDTSGMTSMLLDEVAKLVKLFLVLPSSSCSAERSFSTLRRLKTYLRSTMTAERLNSVTVLHIHKELTADLNIDQLIKEFVSANDARRAIFGVV
jgi:hypothetical protein